MDLIDKCTWPSNGSKTRLVFGSADLNANLSHMGNVLLAKATYFQQNHLFRYWGSSIAIAVIIRYFMPGLMSISYAVACSQLVIFPTGWIPRLINYFFGFSKILDKVVN